MRQLSFPSQVGMSVFPDDAAFQEVRFAPTTFTTSVAPMRRSSKGRRISPLHEGRRILSGSQV